MKWKALEKLMQFTAVARQCVSSNFMFFIWVQFSLTGRPTTIFYYAPLRISYTDRARKAHTHTRITGWHIEIQNTFYFVCLYSNSKPMTTNALMYLLLLLFLSFNYKETNISNPLAACTPTVTHRKMAPSINFTQNTNFIFILRLRYEKIGFCLDKTYFVYIEWAIEFTLL